MTDQTTILRDEIATVPRDPWNPAARMRWLLNLDDTLVTRGGGKSLRIYDELERDGRTYSALRKRKMALLAYPWQVDPASDDPADTLAAEMVRRHLSTLNFREMCLSLQDAILKGFAVAEILWDRDRDGLIAPVKVLAKDQRRFVFDQDRKLRMRDWSNMMDGVELPERKFVVHAVGSKDGSPYGHGLGSILFWYVLFKRQDVTFWLTFLDKFGSPTAVGTYRAGTDPDDQDRLLQAMMTIAQDAGVALPDTVRIELLEAQRSGSVDAYERAARYFDEEITITVLGETLTTSNGGVGSQAATTVHDDVRLELVQGDGELLAATLNETLIAWDVAYNLPDARPPKLKFVVGQEEDLTARANRDKIISDMGYKPTLAYITETYGGEWEERQQPAQLQIDGGDPLDVIEPDPAHAESDHSPDPIDRYAVALAEQADPQIAAMVTRVRDLVGECSGLEDLRDRLLDIHQDLDHRVLAEVMAEALGASAALGAASVTVRK